MQLHENITFGYVVDLNSVNEGEGFKNLDTKLLVKEVELAHKHEYPVLKMWFAPRFVDILEIEDKYIPYKLNFEELEPMFSLAEDYNFTIIIHVSDPDMSYAWKYQPPERYSTKLDRMEDFFDVMKLHPKLKMISAHLGCWPENLPYLSQKLDEFPNLYLDTGSTRWMIRELGKKPEETKNWIRKYASRILFGSDIGVRPEKNIENWATRFWSHKLFWETDHIAPLPFEDSDNPFGTIIRGLNLPEPILEQIYFKTAFKLFNIK